MFMHDCFVMLLGMMYVVERSMVFSCTWQPPVHAAVASIVQLGSFNVALLLFLLQQMTAAPVATCFLDAL